MHGVSPWFCSLFTGCLWPWAATDALHLVGTSTSPASSLNSSEEDLNTHTGPYSSKAKLGDTQELEEFIADLDKVLEEM